MEGIWGIRLGKGKGIGEFSQWDFCIADRFF